MTHRLPLLAALLNAVFNVKHTACGLAVVHCSLRFAVDARRAYSDGIFKLLSFH